MSAQESRRKKKDYVDSLEKQYVKLSAVLIAHSQRFCAVWVLDISL